VPWSIRTDTDGATANALPADFRDTAGANTASSAYPDDGGAPLQLTAANPSRTVTIYTFDDAVAESDAEHFVFAFGNIFGAAGAVSPSGSPLAVEIATSDVAITIACATATPGDLTEGSAATVANCQQNTGAALHSEVALSWAIYEGHGVTAANVAASTATAATDFTANSGTLNLAANLADSTNVPLELTAAADGAAEQAEQFTLLITAASDAGAATRPA